MGAAMRFITSAPAPVAHITGMRPASTVATVMNFGRMRVAAPMAARFGMKRFEPF